ncbi:MAG: diaminopimelate epimerase [Cyanobium sp.]
MLQFSKYQGLGNDFLLLDGRDLSEPDQAFGLTPEIVQRLCDRRFGVGGDGVILALPPREGGELRMRIFNADGSEPEMCGNGIRCLARFLADSDGDGPGRRWQVETLAGRIVPELCADGGILVDMGPPFLEPAAIPTTLEPGPAGLPQGVVEVEGTVFEVAAVGMGNPHVVIPVETVDGIDLERHGAALEVHPAFPARTNVHFVQVLAPDHLRMRVWERGAGATLACGTGACATLVACHRLGLCAAEARLDLPGGPLWISWAGVEGAPVLMRGPAAVVFEGVLAPELLGISSEAPAADAFATGQALATAAPAIATWEANAAATTEATAVIDCASVCINGCVRPEACASAEARARVSALLADRSLDELVALATATAAERSGLPFRAADG